MFTQAETHKNEGNRLLGQGNAVGALACYRAALAHDPDYVPALNNLGVLLKNLGRRREGEQCLRHAIRVTPEDFELHNNLAVLLHEEGRLEEALNAYGVALRFNPDDGFSNGNYGGLLAQMGRSEAALDYCQRAAAACPQSANVLSLLGNVLRDAGKMNEAIPVFQKARQLPGAGIEQISAHLFAQLYPPENARGGEWPAYAEFDREHVQPRLAAGFRHTPRAIENRRLRLGYVSSALRSHATYFFIVGVLAHHDRSRFEVILYDTAIAKDAMTERLIPLADRYVDCAGKVDRALAERIHQDDLDVLVELDGHIGHNAQLALAWKPAPLQITWLGHPHSTGSSAVDVWVTDRHIAGPGIVEHHSERLALLPDFYMVFTPGETPDVTPLPQLKNAYLTLGSFNAPNKLNDQVLDAWGKVLLAIPDARLLIASSPGPVFEARVKGLLSSLGVTDNRVRFARTCSHPEFLALHAQADIALDPFPVNGTTTSLFGLWMGLPLLTVAGQCHRARVGLSLMENLGLPEWIVHTLADLPERAQELTRDVSRLAALRAGLRQQMAVSPLCDAPRFTRHFEALLTEQQAENCRNAPAGV